VQDALEAASPRPDALVASPQEKIRYAVDFAAAIAEGIAGDLRSVFPGITASPKRAAGSVKGPKQLDVNYSTQQLGLGLGISLKSVHLRDAKTDRKTKRKSLGRYTHNMKRNEEELRVEATGYHKRQPYAVMVAGLFLPFESCDDAKGENVSSFASWVRHLRPYCGRLAPSDDSDRFEKIYLALYEANGSDLRFFDVEAPPPKKGRPESNGLLTYGEWLESIYNVFLRRNHADFRWADGTSEPLRSEEIEMPVEEDSEDQ
jgi:hypothetical protein